MQESSLKAHNQKAMNVKEEFPYSYKGYVDATFLTFKEAVQKCICHLSSEITARGVFDQEFQKDVALLNFLNTQFVGVEHFLEEYNKLENTL